MLLSYDLKIVEMKLYYNYIYYHSQAYDFFVFIIISLYLVRLQYIYIGAKVHILHTATMAKIATVIHHCTLQ